MIDVTLACEDGNSKLATAQKEGLREAFLRKALVARLQGLAELLCLVSKIFMLSSKPIGVVVIQKGRFLSTTIVRAQAQCCSPGLEWFLCMQGMLQKGVADKKERGDRRDGKSNV